MGNHLFRRTDNGDRFSNLWANWRTIAKLENFLLNLNQCCSIKRLVGIDGVIAMSSPFVLMIQTLYVFTVFQTKVEEQDEEASSDLWNRFKMTQIKKVYGVSYVFMEWKSLVIVTLSTILEPAWYHMKLDEFISDILITTGSKRLLRIHRR
jgi:hypothetical protein